MTLATGFGLPSLLTIKHFSRYHQVPVCWLQSRVYRLARLHERTRSVVGTGGRSRYGSHVSLVTMLCCIAPNATHHFSLLAERNDARPCCVVPFLLIPCILSGRRRDASNRASYVTSREPAGTRQILARVHQHSLSKASAPGPRYVPREMQIPAMPH
jgi:hypothetical protein